MACVERVNIVGGGIGGLALAVALRQRGIEVAVTESGPLPGEVGAGIGLWANALRVLDGLGVGPAVRALGVPITRGSAHDRRGGVLGDLPLRELSLEGHPFYIVHRAELHACLVDALPPQVLHPHTTCTGVVADSERARLQHAGGDREADLVVGADGLRSVVREALLGAADPSYSGETCWRGIAFGPHPHLGQLREIQGPGQRAGICPIDADRVYWWATHLAPPGDPSPPPSGAQALRDRYDGWPFGLPELLARTPDDAFLRHDLYDRKPVGRWHQGRIALLGDAAHPTTPNLGQGACMALEDAAVLACLLQSRDDLEAALLEYERLRGPRTAAIVRKSRAFGRLGRVSSRPLRTLIEGGLRLLPRAVLHRQFAALARYDAFEVVGAPKSLR